MQNQMQNITIDNFQSVLDAKASVLVFSTDSCHFCQSTIRVLQDLASSYPHVLVGEVDCTDPQGEFLANYYGILAIPSVLGFSAGELHYRRSGAMGAVALERLLRGIE